jgi:hypothetical protein
MKIIKLIAILFLQLPKAPVFNNEKDLISKKILYLSFDAQN